jgi:hypothetical protein
MPILMATFYTITLTAVHKFPALGAEFTEFLPDSLTRIYGAIFQNFIFNFLDLPIFWSAIIFQKHTPYASNVIQLTSFPNHL